MFNGKFMEKLILIRCKFIWNIYINSEKQEMFLFVDLSKLNHL